VVVASEYFQTKINSKITSNYNICSENKAEKKKDKNILKIRRKVSFKSGNENEFGLPVVCHAILYIIASRK